MPGPSLAVPATMRAAFACAFILASASIADADAIDRYMVEQLRRLHIPGASIAVVHAGRPVKVSGYGFADLQLNARATPGTVYEIGSNTKPFTAAAIMLLVQDGRMALDDAVTKYFPGAPPGWARITVRHLLTHTSGIQNHVGVAGFLDSFRTNLAYDTTPGRDALVGRFFQLPLEFEPGESWAYDNTGYYLLGIIIEKVSGRPYFDFLDTRIFKPLGMTATRSTDPRPLVPNRASGYEWVKGVFENRPVLLPAIGFSAGTIVSTVEDLARWDAALYTDALLTKSSRDAIWTPALLADGTTAPVSYGFGWFVGGSAGHRIVQHSGGTPGFSSTIYRFVDDRLTVIVLTNHSDRIVDQLAIEIAGLFAPWLKRWIAGPDPAPDTTRRLERVFARLLRGEVDVSLFTPPMRTFLRTTTGTGMWQWFASHGALSSFTFSSQEPAGAGRIVRYRVGLGEGHYWFFVNLAADGRIAQVFLG